MALYGHYQPRRGLHAHLEFPASRSVRQLFFGLLASRGIQLYTTAPKVRTLARSIHEGAARGRERRQIGPKNNVME